MKKILTALLLIISTPIVYAQTSQVYVFVTYQTKNLKVKPDAGATVLLITPDENPAYVAEFNAYEKNVFDQVKAVYDIHQRIASLQIELDRLSVGAHTSERKKQMQTTKARLKTGRERLKTANEDVKKAQLVFVQNINQLFEKYKTLVPDSCRKIIDSTG